MGTPREFSPMLVPDIMVRRKLQGFVYVMERVSSADCVKIGYSVRPYVRATRVDARVGFTLPTCDMVGLERALHQRFRHQYLRPSAGTVTRDGDWEWFRVPLPEVVAAMEQLAKTFSCPHPVYYLRGNLRSSKWRPFERSYLVHSHDKLDIVRFCVEHTKGAFADHAHSFGVQSNANVTAFERIVKCLIYNWSIEQATQLARSVGLADSAIRFYQHPDLHVWLVDVMACDQQVSLVVPNISRKHVYFPAKDDPEAFSDAFRRAEASPEYQDVWRKRIPRGAVVRWKRRSQKECVACSVRLASVISADVQSTNV